MKPYHDTLTRTAPPADRFTRRLFTSVCCEGPPLRRELLDCPTLIVSSHRSHMDYILLGIHCSRLGYRNLRFAAGDNVTSLPYVGAKFSAMGAFPVCRDRVSSRRYIVDLCEEVAAMLGDGDNVVGFPEGGRSYSGQMLKMKSGLIAASIIAQARSAHRKHYCLPFTVSYEVLPEIGHLDWLQKARRLRGDKRSQAERVAGSLFWYGADLAAFARLILSARSGSVPGAGYGNVYLDYAEPLAIEPIVGIEKGSVSNAANALVAHRAATRRAAEEIRRQLVRLYRILPMHVVAHELNREFNGKDAIMARTSATVDRLQALGRNCKLLHGLSAAEIFEQGTAQLRRLDAVDMRGGVLRSTRANVVDYCAHALDP